ncbi:hypothetical protein TNCV_1334301 [Trichonephila clavipes]|nr:hypothetical protein TNCV_1334301 [Trichonephila clavipes]
MLAIRRIDDTIFIASFCVILSATALWVASFVRDGFVGCVITCDVFLPAWLRLQWIEGATTAAAVWHCQGHLGRKVRSEYLLFPKRVS